MTLTEKIIARHAEVKGVKPGEIVEVRVDGVLANDITAPGAISAFREIGVDKVFDPERIYLVPDHFTPNKDIKSAEQCRLLREFAREMKLPYYFEVGRMGIEHALLPEEGLVLPGELVIGADSHTCTYGALGAFATGVGSTDLGVAMATGWTWLKVPFTIKLIYHGRPRRWIGGKDLILYTIGRIGVQGALYKALEFSGEAISHLSMDNRFTMANMAIEAGAKNGIIEPDEKTLSYVRERAKRDYGVIRGDREAEYERILEFDVESIEPQIAFPHLPSNTKGISQVGEVRIDQVVIGSCTNGRLEDLRVAASILNGKKVHPRVRLIVIPATQRIYREAMKEGLLETFVQAGGVVSTPTCGPCLGGHMGVLAKGERAIATTNRNFVGRMGHKESEVYLSGPAVAATSAVTGRISSPEEVMN
jgi:3-isopropylmalate/(R)-2-methylmalate dehydratase large subunit